MSGFPPPPRRIPSALKLHLMVVNLGVVFGSLPLFLGTGLMFLAGGWSATLQDFSRPSVPQQTSGYLHRTEPTDIKVNRQVLHEHTFSYEHPVRGRIVATSYSHGAKFAGPGIVDVEYDDETSWIAETQVSRLGPGGLFVLIPAGLGALLVLGGLAVGRRRIRVLREGLVADAPVSGMRIDGPRRRIREVPLSEARSDPELLDAHEVHCAFTFTTQNGQVVEAEDTVAALDRFGAGPTEPVLYDPAHPQWAYLLNGSGIPASRSADGRWQPPKGIRRWLALGLLGFAITFFPMLDTALGKHADPSGEAVERVQPKDVALDLGGGLSMEFVTVPAGQLNMGSWERHQTPVHRVGFSRPYSIGKREVSVAQFRRFVAATGYRTDAERDGGAKGIQDGQWKVIPGITWRAPGFPQENDHPVVLVTRADALAFAAWASRQTGREIDLPTEAQWEYAARGGTAVRYPWGNRWDEKRLNHRDAPSGKPGINADGFAFTAPAGSYPASASWCGALDLAGNAWEWVKDTYSERYYSDSPIEDPQGPAGGGNGILRGGSWADVADLCRTSVRYDQDPSSRETHTGFRVALRLAPR